MKNPGLAGVFLWVSIAEAMAAIGVRATPAGA